MILQRIPEFLEAAEIQEDLEERGFEGSRTSKVYGKQKFKKKSTCRWSLGSKASSKKIYYLTKIGKIKIQMEAYKHYNVTDMEHNQSGRRQILKCVKCASSHSVEYCSKLEIQTQNVLFVMVRFPLTTGGACTYLRSRDPETKHL